MLKKINELDNEIFIKRCSLDNKKKVNKFYEEICPDEKCLGYICENKCNICHLNVCNSCRKIVNNSKVFFIIKG